LSCISRDDTTTFCPGCKEPTNVVRDRHRVLASASGFVDRPQIAAQLNPDIRQTMELLVRRGVLAPEAIPLPDVRPLRLLSPPDEEDPPDNGPWSPFRNGRR
jgi:hypothetical protein